MNSIFTIDDYKAIRDKVLTHAQQELLCPEVCATMDKLTKNVRFQDGNALMRTDFFEEMRPLTEESYDIAPLSVKAFNVMSYAGGVAGHSVPFWFSSDTRVSGETTLKTARFLFWKHLLGDWQRNDQKFENIVKYKMPGWEVEYIWIPGRHTEKAVVEFGKTPFGIIGASSLVFLVDKTETDRLAEEWKSNLLNWHNDEK